MTLLLGIVVQTMNRQLLDDAFEVTMVLAGSEKNLV